MKPHHWSTSPNKVSALSLLSNAVLVWNTVRIAEIVRDLERSVDRPMRRTTSTWGKGFGALAAET